MQKEAGNGPFWKKHKTIPLTYEKRLSQDNDDDSDGKGFLMFFCLFDLCPLFL